MSFTEPISLKLEKEEFEQLEIAREKDNRTRVNAIRTGIRMYIQSVLNE